MNEQEQSRLIEELLEGDISDSDFLRLEAEMIVNEEARQAYYERQKLQTTLELEAESSAGDGVPSPVPERRKRDPSFDWLIASAVTALVFLVGLLTWRGVSDARSIDGQGPEPVASGFAVVSAQSGTTWRGDESLEDGDLLPLHPITLENGLAEVELFTGVLLVIDRETTFEILSPTEAKLLSGSIRALIPTPAEGFRLLTEEGEVTASTSEFVATTSPGKETRILVSGGEVEWNPAGGGAQTISVGQSVGSQPFEEQQLARLSAFREQLSSGMAERLQAWEEFHRTYSRDPRLLACYPIPSPSDPEREWKDASGNARHGTIVRASRSPDRWGRSGRALDFTPTGSRVRVTIPGEHESLTLMCWVKIDSLDRWYNSLFLTDGHELHEPHWQIMNDGRIFFSVRATDKKGSPDKHISFSPPIWTPADSGQWMHIATVYDGKEQTTTHYVNGKAISIDSIPEEFHPEKVVIGAASIGNWSEPRYRKDAEFAVRNLNGSMDEFALFDAPLSAQEIFEIHAIGKP